jgi:hypothetical protein
MNAAEQAAFRRQLDALASWKNRMEKIEARLKEKAAALAAAFGEEGNV